MKLLNLEIIKLKKKTRSWLGPILIFWLIMIAYPLTVELSKENIEVGFFSVLWISILLSMMFATEDIFTEDYNDGSLEQSLINDAPFAYYVGVKVLIRDGRDWFCINIENNHLFFLKFFFFVFSL